MDALYAGARGNQSAKTSYLWFIYGQYTRKVFSPVICFSESYDRSRRTTLHSFCAYIDYTYMGTSQSPTILLCRLLLLHDHSPCREFEENVSCLVTDAFYLHHTEAPDDRDEHGPTDDDTSRGICLCSACAVRAAAEVCLRVISDLGQFTHSHSLP